MLVRKPFVPLRDLLQRNHEDRVREYLDKMKGLTLDEIVNTQTLNSKPGREDARSSRVTPEKLSQQDLLKGGVSPMAGPAGSSFSMGITPKQKNIIDSTKAQAILSNTGKRKWLTTNYYLRRPQEL